MTSWPAGGPGRAAERGIRAGAQLLSAAPLIALEIIEGLREPDGGEVSVLGMRPWPRNPALLPRIGVQLQASSFFERPSCCAGCGPPR